MKILLVSSVVALAAILAAPAYAATCSIGSVAGIAFGVYDVFSNGALDSAGTLTYRCDDVGALDTIKIQLSRGSSPSFESRTLQQGVDVLRYNLYLDPSRSTIWGDGSGSSQYGPILPPNASSVQLNIYGRVPARQNVRAGSYSDTVVVTIVF